MTINFTFNVTLAISFLFDSTWNEFNSESFLRSTDTDKVKSKNQIVKFSVGKLGFGDDKFHF